MDPALKAQVDAQIAQSAGLTKDEEKEALDREIELRAKHLDLDQLEAGKYPDRLIAEWSAKGGMWKVIALVVDILRRFFYAS